MTTPAFNHLITIDAVSVEYRRSELEQVAADLRNERTLGAPPTPGSPNRFRLAIGTALLQAGSALVASPSRSSTQAR